MEYIMQEMPDVHKTGEKKFYPKVKHAHCIGHETIGNAYVDLTTMPRSWFEGVMKGLPEVLNSGLCSCVAGEFVWYVLLWNLLALGWCLVSV